MAGRQDVVELIKDLSSTFSAEKVLDFLFPKFCAGCEREGSWLCENCLQEKVINKTAPNPSSAKERNYKPPPSQRRGQGEVSSLDGITALFDYGENTPSKLIKMVKYNYLLKIVDIFAKIITDIKFNHTWQDFVIIPVPLHPRRERERGFNQAEILAKIFSEKFGLSINKNLRRVIYTAQQAKLSGEERRNNLKDAFVWDDGVKIAPEKVLLADDVFTTGATMQECAKVLKNNGVKAVWGLVLARG